MRGTDDCASVTVIVFDTLSLGDDTTTGKRYVPAARPTGFTASVSTPVLWFTAHVTRVFAGVGRQEMVPRLASVPAPALVTDTVADAGVVPVPTSEAAKLTVAALSVRTGWSMIRFAVIDPGFDVPGAVTTTCTGAGLAVSPDGLAVSVRMFPSDTLQVSQGAGLAAQLTGPNRPSPPFWIAILFTIGVVEPRTARKSTEGSDGMISTRGAMLSAQPDARTTSGRRAANH